MGGDHYDPRLSEAGFMDLVCALIKRLDEPESNAQLAAMRPAERQAALQLGTVARNYVEVIEGRSAIQSLLDRQVEREVRRIQHDTFAGTPSEAQRRLNAWLAAKHSVRIISIETLIKQTSTSMVSVERKEEIGLRVWFEMDQQSAVERS